MSLSTDRDSRAVPRRQPHVVARRLRDAGVLVNLRTNEIFELNDSAMRVWEMLDAPVPLDAIVSTLVAEFTVTAATAEAETLQIFERLKAQGLVR